MLYQRLTLQIIVLHVYYELGGKQRLGQLKHPPENAKSFLLMSRTAAPARETGSANCF